MSLGNPKLPERFWNKVCPNPDTGCWEWRGWRSQAGYAYVWDGTYRPSGGPRSVRAHRFAFEALRSAIPTGKVLDHLCRVRHCVNPDHLEPVTVQENVQRGTLPQTMVGNQRTRGVGIKLKEEDVVSIFYDSRSRKEIAQDWGISVEHVRVIKARLTWTHVTQALPQTR